jgi:putative tricarboxylic transport membrane protein
MTEKNMARADFYTGIVLIAFGITITVMARLMPDIPRDPYSAPGVLPTFLGVVITGLSLVMFIRSIARTKGQVGISGSSIKNILSVTGTLRILATVILCLAYVFLLGKLPFPLLTFFFIFGFIIFFEYERSVPLRSQIKKILIAILVASVTSVTITAIFRYLFLVRLP